MIDIIHGRAGVMTWIFLPLLSIVGLFEIGSICEARKKNPTTPEQTTEA